MEALRHRLEAFSQPIVEADGEAAAEAKRRLAGRVPADLLALLRPGWAVLEPVKIEAPEALLPGAGEAAADELTLVGREADGTRFGFRRGQQSVQRLVDDEVQDTGVTLVAWLERQLELAEPRLWRWALERIEARGAPQKVPAAELAELERQTGVPLPAPLSRFLRETGRVGWPLTIAPAPELDVPDSAPQGVLWFGVRDGTLFGFNPDDGPGEDLVVSFEPGDELDTLYVEDAFGWWLIAEVSIAEQAEQPAAEAAGGRLDELLGVLQGAGSAAEDELVVAEAEHAAAGELAGEVPADDDLADDDLADDDLAAGDDLAVGDVLAAQLLAGLGLGGDPETDDGEPELPGGPVGELLQALVGRSWLELESPRDLPRLALRAEAMLEREGPLALRDLDEWLLDQGEVVELYCEREQLLGLARELSEG